MQLIQQKYTETTKPNFISHPHHAKCSSPQPMNRPCNICHSITAAQGSHGGVTAGADWLYTSGFNPRKKKSNLQAGGSDGLTRSNHSLQPLLATKSKLKNLQQECSRGTLLSSAPALLLHYRSHCVNH